MRKTRQGSPPTTDTVAAISASFIARHARANTKPSSAEQTERIFRRYVLPKWGERRVQDITRRDVIDLLDGIVDRGAPIAANRALAVVRKFFNWALDRSIIETSPCIRVGQPAEDRSRDRVLSDEELRLVWLAAERVGWPFGPLIQILMLTGQRRNEVAGMSRTELRDAGALWTIPGERTKNGVANDVPLADMAQTILANVPRIARSDFVFTPLGIKPISTFSRGKERLDALMLAIAHEDATEARQDASAVTLAPWRIHDLRRTAASGMARLGFPIHVIEAVLNHRSGQISGVAAVYNRHSYLPEKRRALEAWAAHVTGLVNGTAASNVVPLRAAT
jgi:integrase